MNKRKKTESMSHYTNIKLVRQNGKCIEHGQKFKEKDQ